MSIELIRATLANTHPTLMMPDPPPRRSELAAAVQEYDELAAKYVELSKHVSELERMEREGEVPY